MGHSMGGLLALHFALEQSSNNLSINGIILSAPAFKPGTPIHPFKYHTCHALEKIFPKISVDNGLNLANLSRDPRIIADYKKDKLVHSKVTLDSALMIIETGKDAVKRGSEVRWPIYVAHGSADILTDPVSSEEFMKNVSNNLGTFVKYEGYYHELHNEPKEYRDVVMKGYVDWIKEQL